jgi:hypothetical protein
VIALEKQGCLSGWCLHQQLVVVVFAAAPALGVTVVGAAGGLHNSTCRAAQQL